LLSIFLFDVDVITVKAEIISPAQMLDSFAAKMPVSYVFFYKLIIEITNNIYTHMCLTL